MTGRYENLEVKFDREESPALAGLSDLLDEQGYQICLNPFYKMEESDWVILRLLMDMESDAPINYNTYKAVQYLEQKYGMEVIEECGQELIKEWNDANDK